MLFRADRRFRAEGLAHVLMRFNVRPTDEIDAVGDSSKNAADHRFALIVAQTFQCFAYGFWLTRQIHDERCMIGGFADDSHLTGQNRGGYR